MRNPTEWVVDPNIIHMRHTLEMQRNGSKEVKRNYDDVKEPIAAHLFNN